MPDPDETPTKVDHQEALELAEFYIARGVSAPGQDAATISKHERAANLARCYKHNRDQLAELRATRGKSP